MTPEKKDLIQAYLNTVYQIENSDTWLNLKIGDSIHFENSTFCIITAENPQSKRISSDENKIRMQELENDLIDLKLKFVKSKHLDSRGIWPTENGYAVFDIKRFEALELAEKYEQHAIVYKEQKAKSELIWVSDS